MKSAQNNSEVENARAGVPGYRVPDVQNKGCGKHGAWKTRGVSGKRGVKVENTGYGFFFSPKYEFSSL